MIPSQLTPFLRRMILHRRPVLILGGPGLGKTEITYQVTEALQFAMRLFPLHLYERPDVAGYPHVGPNGRMAMTPSDMLPLATDKLGPGVLFLDEITQCDLDVQKPALQLVRGGWIGAHQLHPEWRIVAAGNLAGNRAGEQRMGTALQDRFCVVTLEPHYPDWRAFAVRTGVSPSVVRFLDYRGHDLFYTFNPNAPPTNKGATARGWVDVSDDLQALLDPTIDGPPLDDTTLTDAVRGRVGEAAALEFVAWLGIQLPDLADIVADPRGAKLPVQPGAYYAMAGALAELAKRTPTAAAAIATYIARWPDREPARYAIREISLAAPVFTAQPAILAATRTDPVLSA